jgi:hypothetical protein
MARRGGGEAGKVLLAVGGVILLAWLVGGRGKDNSPLLPAAIEDPMDRVLAALNNMFGHEWVDRGLNYLQTQLELAMPGAAAFVKAAYWAEQNYRGQAGAVKKQAALRALRA